MQYNLLHIMHLSGIAVMYINIYLLQCIIIYKSRFLCSVELLIVVMSVHM